MVVARSNVEVTGAARLYRAASGGPQGYASGSRATAFAGEISTSAVVTLGGVNGGVAVKTERLVVVPNYQVGLATNWAVKCSTELVWSV